MVNVREYSFPSKSAGQEIYAVEWRPAGAPRAVLQIAHGLDEHIMRYDGFARYMAGQGFLVAGNDHLGHGRTAKRPEDFCFFAEKDGWNCVTADMAELFRRTREGAGHVPYFMLGHSMGSFLLRTYLIDRPGGLAGAVVMGTGQMPRAALEAGIVAAKAEELRLGARGRSPRLNDLCFAAYNKKFSPAETPVDWISRDREVCRQNVADPLTGHIPTAELFNEMLGALRYIAEAKNLAKMDKALPVLFVSGGQDPVGDFGKGPRKAGKSFIDAGCEDVSLKIYPDDRHEVLNELNRAEVYRDVCAWIESKM